MVKRGLFRSVLIITLVLMCLFSIQIVNAAWTSWVYEHALVDYPVTGGTMDGQTGASWWDGAELRWKVWAGTWPPYSNTIQTYVQGEDRCSYTSWTFQMGQVQTYYYTSAGTSGIVEGNYLNGAAGHDYRVYYSGWRKQYAWSDWEGANAYTHEASPLPMAW